MFSNDKIKSFASVDQRKEKVSGNYSLVKNLTLAGEVRGSEVTYDKRVQWFSTWDRERTVRNPPYVLPLITPGVAARMLTIQIANSVEKNCNNTQFITWWKLLGNPGSHFKCMLRFVKWHKRRQNLYEENSHLPDGALTTVIASCTDVLRRRVSIGTWNTIRTVHFVTMDTNISFSCTLCYSYEQSMQC